MGGYLARRGWTDEQIAAVARALPTARSDAEKLRDVLECARATRASDGEVGAGWSGLVQWLPEIAAVIESIARDPDEPKNWTGIWSPAWKALTLGFEAQAKAHRAKRARPDPGASAFAPPANDCVDDGLIWGALSENPPRQDFLVPELEIGVGRPYGWVGKTNASKTLTLMQLEVDLALGRPVFGQFDGPGKPVPVLRIAYEGFAKAPEDYLRLLRGTGASLDFAELGSLRAGDTSA